MAAAITSNVGQGLSSWWEGVQQETRDLLGGIQGGVSFDNGEISGGVSFGERRVLSWQVLALAVVLGLLVGMAVAR